MQRTRLLSSLSLGIRMRTLSALMVLFGVMHFCSAAESPSNSQEGRVWYWQAKDSRQKMQLEVRLDNKTVLCLIAGLGKRVV